MKSSPAQQPAFEEAGDDRDLRQAYIESMVGARHTEAVALLREAQALIQSSSTRRSRSRAENLARGGLELFARSLDWAEDTDMEQAAHDKMDQAGSWVRHQFGCWMAQRGRNYSQTCPVALAHNRIGFSVGGVAVHICSLCGNDVSECEHLRGTAYSVPGGSDDLGWCRVCLKESGCEHSREEKYRVSLVSIIKQMDLEEVSIVNKPAQPEARLASVSISLEELTERVGKQFRPGSAIPCDICLIKCNGLVKNSLPARETINGPER